MRPLPINSDLVYQLSEARWQPRALKDQNSPLCINRIPLRLRLGAMASGDLIQPVEMYLENVTVVVVGGLDSYRYAPDGEERGYPVDKDHFLIIENRIRRYVDSQFVTVGPFKRDGDHHLQDLPSEVYQAKLL